MRAFFILSAMLAAAPGALRPQTVDDVRRIAADGDTAGAIAAAEAILRRDRHNAEAHYLAGRLYLSQHVPGARVSRARRAAEEHLRYATRVGEDSAKYWLALADLFRADDMVTVRMQVPRLLRRAREALRATADDSLAAELGFREARAAFERHEHFGRRHVPADVGRAVAVPGTFAEWKYWEEFLEHGVRDVPVAGEDLARAEALLRQVLRSRPGDVRSAGLLVVTLGEGGRWAETIEVARVTVGAAPDSGRAWAILGLALARTARWTEAAAAFDSAFTHMTPDEVTPYRDLGRIMRRADRDWWDTIPPPARLALDSLYWRVAQPLMLTEANEAREEFYARITYVEHRWSDPWIPYRGFETDIGSVYIAYGPPDHWLVFDRQLLVWVYGDTHFRFAFLLTPGYARARFAGESREGLRMAQQESPARFDNVPLYRTLDTLLVQVTQFRAEPDTTAVVVFGAIPLARLSAAAAADRQTMTTGAFVTDVRGRELQRDRREDAVGAPGADGVVHRSWRLRMAPGDYLLRAEAHIPGLDRGARATAPVTIRDFAPGLLTLSDLLAADRLSPRDSVAHRWDDFLIEPNGGRFLPGNSVALLWEIYGLTADAAGLAHFDVALRFTVDAIERRTFIARIVGGLGDASGLSALGDDQVTLDYDRRVVLDPDGIAVEHLTVELRDAPEGRYTVEAAVRDRRTGLTATTTRTILVRTEPPSRRAGYTTFR